MFASRICEPASSSVRVSCAFTVACVPTGMKSGVCTSSCRVRNVAARAREPVAVAFRRKSRRDELIELSRVTSCPPVETAADGERPSYLRARTSCRVANPAAFIALRKRYARLASTDSRRARWSCRKSTGLVRWVSNPACRERLTSSSMP